MILFERRHATENTGKDPSLAGKQLNLVSRLHFFIQTSLSKFINANLSDLRILNLVHLRSVIGPFTEST
jgi:hypothetical protein